MSFALEEIIEIGDKLEERRRCLEQTATEQDLLDGSTESLHEWTLQDAIDAGVDFGVNTKKALVKSSLWSHVVG